MSTHSLKHRSVDTESGTTLIPMLVWGLILIVIGMIGIMALV